MLSGVLFFPVTPFGPDGTLDRDALRSHLERGLAAGPGGVFAACGTGEFHALGPDEYAAVVADAVEVTAGRVPVFAGSGGPLPYAIACARAAAKAGADGLLLMPPYLVAAPQAGLVAYVTAVADATGLDVIVYHRGNAVFTPASAVAVAAHPRVVGLKDGVGDLDAMARITVAVRESVGDDVMFFNGLPTAEVSQPAYRGIGVELYSSAVFGFVPKVSLAYQRALASDDDTTLRALQREFFHPLVALRDEVPGYAVSLIKAGVTLTGIDAGPPRPPLVPAAPEHVDRLRDIVAAGNRVVAAGGRAAS